jgi:hypothetical protein
MLGDAGPITVPENESLPWMSTCRESDTHPLSAYSPVAVGVLTHNADDDYDLGEQLIVVGRPAPVPLS